MVFRISILLFLIACVSTSSFAQLTEVRTTYPNYNSQLNTRTTEDSTAIQLPFWDDFSRSEYLPDTSHWVDSDNVTIYSGIGIEAPSVNVATFDGLNSFGNPHSGSDLFEGIGDCLKSRFIDLSGVGIADSLYISFYFQNGDRASLYTVLIPKWVEMSMPNRQAINLEMTFQYSCIYNQHATYQKHLITVHKIQT